MCYIQWVCLVVMGGEFVKQSSLMLHLAAKVGVSPLGVGSPAACCPPTSLPEPVQPLLESGRG